MKPRIVTVQTQDHEDPEKGYLLTESDMIAMIVIPPRCRGQCLCIVNAYLNRPQGNIYIEAMAEHKRGVQYCSYVNLGAAELARVAKRMAWIAKRHVRNRVVEVA